MKLINWRDFFRLLNLGFSTLFSPWEIHFLSSTAPPVLRQKRYGLLAICEGGGTANATIASWQSGTILMPKSLKSLKS